LIKGVPPNIGDQDAQWEEAGREKKTWIRPTLAAKRNNCQKIKTAKKTQRKKQNAVGRCGFRKGVGPRKKAKDRSGFKMC